MTTITRQRCMQMPFSQAAPVNYGIPSRGSSDGHPSGSDRSSSDECSSMDSQSRSLLVASGGGGVTGHYVAAKPSPPPTSSTDTKGDRPIGYGAFGVVW